MLVPEEGAEPVTITDHAIDAKVIPRLGATFDDADDIEPAEEPSEDEKEKRAHERRVRARRRAKERRAKLRAAGLICMCVAAFFGLIVGMVELIRFSNKSSLTGTVTYEGRPIANGYITFTPVDGRGAATSARIVNGVYEMNRPTVGDSVVLITAVAETQFSKARPDPNQLEAAPSAAPDLVGPDAIGNKKVVTVQKGKHILNFDLKAPPPPPKDAEKKDEPGSPPPGR